MNIFGDDKELLLNYTERQSLEHVLDTYQRARDVLADPGLNDHERQTLIEIRDLALGQAQFYLYRFAPNSYRNGPH